VQVLQLHPASDAIAQLHGWPHVNIDMKSSDNSIMPLMAASDILLSWLAERTGYYPSRCIAGLDQRRNL
jgi:hypothetical protein